MPQPPRIFLITAALLCAALVFHQTFRRSTISVLRFPFTVTKALARMIVTLPHLPSLTQENERLRLELLQRQLEAAQLREALRHAEQAHTLLESAHASQGLVAGVIGRSMIPTQQTLLLDKGGRHGLTVDSVVLDADGVIGRVTDVHPETSLVTLLTDPDSRVAGIVERSRESGLLVGRAQGQCEFIYLDDQADLNEGDRVVTAGLGRLFPKGLLLGRVVHVYRDEQAGTAWASVEPTARLGRVEEVLCLPPATP